MIKNVSSTFKANCKKDSVKYREYIVIDNKEVDIKGNLSDTAYKDNTFFGKFNLKMLKFETENDIDYKKKEFVYYKEVDGEALKIGTFIVTEVKDSDTFESVNVTAYDYGLKFAKPYTTKLNYLDGNVTLFQVVQEICTDCGVELENASLPNGDFIVDSNQFVNGEQFGDVVAQASGINGMFATTNSNDKLEFIFTNETNEIIEDYVELDDKRDTQPITSVLVATSEDLETAGAVKKDQSLIEQYGEHWLKIYSYGFAYSTEKCQQLVDAIFNQVKGFAYSSFKSEYSFLPYLSLGDKIKFKNKDGKLVDSIILRYETNYDEMILEAPSIISASVDYELPETPETTSKKALFKVDQALGEIDAISKKIVDISSTASGVGFVNITNGSKGILHKLDIYGTLELPIVGGQLGSNNTDKYIKPLIVGQFTVNNFKIIVKQGDNTKEYIIDDMKNLYQIGTTHDTFEYLDGKCSIIRRIGLNNDGTKYILDTSYVEQLKDLNIEVPEGDYTISTNYELHLDVEYLTQNQYTDTFAKQVDLQSEINIRSDEIELLSKKKVNNDEVIASINLTPEKAQINANKISLKGKEISLTSDNININSTNFKVDKDGNCTANSFNSNNAIITGGRLTLNDSGETINASVVIKNNILGYDTMTQLYANGMVFMDNDNNYNLIIDYDKDLYQGHFIRISGESSETLIESDMIQSPHFNQVSLKEYKKDFEKLDNALSIIKNTDIYKYHLKSQSGKEQKHIGLVIGDEFKYSKEILSPKQDGVDLYSMISTCFKAIQEQQEQIEKLEKRIEKLERNDK